ncbi:DUF6221 family protein [Glycomyces sp. A-F 0318]|uniref:DUF6221 family protein n=1 Tax=Glycomyces amatae TaxID=2881355 RepID=UPI001E2B46A5|nr:DUF6221 family protein [Glycomyces amatae]MCD0446379.1 DUF6221 family protein [Glycomyces amatae]
MTDLDLIAFLRDRLDEDEKLATEAADEGVGVILGRIWAAALDAKEMMQEPDGTEERYLDQQRQQISQAQKMLALGEPRRALRDIDAKRKLLDRFRRAVILRSHPGGKKVGNKHHAALGPVLEVLATVYSDHPDYREKWLVGGTDNATAEPTTAPGSPMDEFEAGDDTDRRWE